MDVGPLFGVVLGIIGVVLLVTIFFAVLNSGKSTFSSANDELTSAVNNMSTSTYDVYDGTTTSGSGVIECINNSWEDDNVQIVVSTPKPSDRTKSVTLMYDYEVCFNSGEKYAGDLTNLPAKAYGGENMNDKEAWNSKITPAKHTDGSGQITCYTAGYYKNEDQGTEGYISENATFSGSVQRDVNGEVRRVTFIQNK